MSNSQRPDHDDYKRDIRFDKLPEPSKLPYPGKRPSRMILFLLMWAPGLGHMYMGLIKRGLFFFSALPLLIYLTVLAPNTFAIFTSFGISALYAVSFFEGLSIRRGIIEGKSFSDTIPDLRVFWKNKFVRVILIITLVFAVVDSVLSSFPPVLVIIAVVLAIVFIMSKHGKRGKDDGSDNK